MSMIGHYFRTSSTNMRRMKFGKLDLYKFIDKLDESEQLDIDKTWQAIQFTLTGTTGETDETGEPPWGNLVIGNDYIIPYEFPLSFISAKEVREIAEAMKAMDEAEFRKIFDFKKMVSINIYPLVYGEDEEEFFDYVYGYFAEMRKFFFEAAAKGLDVAFYID